MNEQNGMALELESAPNSKHLVNDKVQEEEEVIKPVRHIFQLFRYATALDWFLIVISLIMAIIHGAAIPLSTIVFGRTINSFSSLFISDQVFVTISTDNISIPLESFMFVEGDLSLTPITAAQGMVIDEAIVNTQEKLTIFFDTLGALSQTNVSRGVSTNISCLIYQYANDTNQTAFEILDMIVNSNLTIPSSFERCNCVSAFFVFFPSINCLSSNDFLHGVPPNDGILWHVYFSLMIATAVLIISYFQISFIQIACERQIQKIRLLFYKSVLKQNIGWFDITASGELASRLNSDVDSIHKGIGQGFAILVQWISSFIVGLVVAFVYSWQLSLVLIVLIPLMAGSVIISSLITSWFNSNEQTAYAQAGSVAEEVLSAIKTVAAFGGEEKEIKRYQQCLTTAGSLGIKKGLSVGISFFFVYFLIFTSFAIVLWFGSFLYDEDLLELGDMLTVFFSMLIAAFAIGVATGDLQNFSDAFGSASVVYSTIDRAPLIDSSSTNGIIPDKMNPSIEFKDVCFSYPVNPQIQILKGIDMKIDVGKTVALVGPSGSGKSTVVQILQRFYDIAGGQVLIGGQDIRALNLGWLRKNIGVVSQEPILFDTTIAENIRFGREDATQEDIEWAAKKANAHNFISQFPDGYQTQVGERGAQMSGGQKQRIAIARALVRDPKILLLDEATSALDTESERVVQDALEKAREGRTTIIIAHRLSTIRTADAIASIEGGRIVEMGTHSELMENKGLYYQLVTAQSHEDADKEFVLSNPLKKIPSNKSFHRRTSRSIYRRRSSGGVKDVKPTFVRQLTRQISKKFSDTSLTSDQDGEVSLTCKTQRCISRGYSKHNITIDEEVSYDRMEDLQVKYDCEIPKVPLKRILSYLAKDWRMLAIGVVGAVVVGTSFPLFGIVFGEALAVVFDYADGIFDKMHKAAGGMLAIGVALGTANFFKSLGLSVFGQRLTKRLRVDSFKSVLKQEIGWFDNEENATGILTLRLSQDAANVQGIVEVKLIETVVGLVCFVFASFGFSWLTSFAALSLIPFMVVSGVLRTLAYNRSTSVTKQALEQSNKLAVDSFDNIRAVASLSLEDIFFKKYQEQLTKPFRQSLLLTPLLGFSYGFTFAVLYLGYAVTFGFGGGFQFLQDTTSILYADIVGLFIVFVAVVFGSLVAGQTSIFIPNFNRAKLSARRIFFLIDKQSQIDASSDTGDKLEEVNSKIDLKNVQFSYPTRPNAPVLCGLSVSVKPGQTLALVGTSGSGKSTLVTLIERFYDPLSGCITLDDKEIKDLNLRWLRTQIGLVSQEPVLFDASIADNIRYGANFRDVSDEEVVEAAKAANIHNFIDTLPNGYTTNVGAKGGQMSGGQKQRIAIARALVRDPKILLLDEATSALDTESERVVQEALDKARESRTTIIIAHRLSTIHSANIIAVLHKGNVKELGNHHELMEKRGIYYRLNNLQAN